MPVMQSGTQDEFVEVRQFGLEAFCYSAIELIIGDSKMMNALNDAE